jgi:anaphase-promoting complex subunit 5
MYRSLSDVLYVLALVHHNLGMESDQNDTIERKRQCEQVRHTTEHAQMEEEATRVMDVVYRVGSALASR